MAALPNRLTPPSDAPPAAAACPVSRSPQDASPAKPSPVSSWSAITPVNAPAPYGPAPAPRTISARATSSGGSELQITQPPNGSFCGTPSSVTNARPAPDGAMERSETPCTVGFADNEELRRNSESPGTCDRALSSWPLSRNSSASNEMLENAALPTGSGGAALTTTVSTSAAWANDDSARSTAQQSPRSIVLRNGNQPIPSSLLANSPAAL